MKRIIFTLFLMIGAICANAQTAKIYKGGTVVQTIDNIDSVRFNQETTTIDIPSYAFSVAADKKVLFSPGNLQYTQSTNTWAFAANQYDIIGAANVSDGALADKIDLFGWSSDNTAAPFGVSTSTTTADYAGDFVDWGTNTIGTDAPNTWRTLTLDEWTYLFQHTHWTMAKVNGLLGFMLLPDGFVAPAGLTVAVVGDGTLSGNARYFSGSAYVGNVYTAAEFAQLEAAGVVFLPCAANRVGETVVAVGEYGNYWSATRNDNEAWTLYTISSAVSMSQNLLYRGNSVRLVQDVPPPAAGSVARTSADEVSKITKEIKTRVVTVYQPGDKAHRFAEVDSVVVCPTVVLPSPAFSVSADKQITFSAGNLQYTQSTNTWAFAKHQYDILGNANRNTDNTVADRIDLFGWSADNTTAPFGIRLSTDNANYAGAFVDWGANSIGSYAPNTWRTLTLDEWEYLLTTRANAAERMGVARINLNDAGSEFANGLILLPDDWTCPAGVTFKSGGAASNSEAAYGEYQTFTLAQWQALEEAGAVFLPATGDWSPANTYVGRINQYGYVHTATTHGSLEAWNVTIRSDIAVDTNWDNRKNRKPVRLVRDL